MNFWTIVKSALSSLAANKLRSTLAVLGIIIGVAAVIDMLAIGAGARQDAMERITDRGANMLSVWAGQRGTGGVMSGALQVLTIEDAQCLLREVPHIKQVSPSIYGSVQIKYLNHNARVTLNGGAATWLPMHNYQIEEGRFFTEAEVEGKVPVCVIGPATAENLMAGESGVGQIVKLNGLNVRVVGVLKPRGSNYSGSNPDDRVFMPYTTAMKRVLGERNIHGFDVQATDEAYLRQVEDDMTAVLRRRHRIRDGVRDDFTISNQADLIAMRAKENDMFQYLLASVASISLLVGGIGIMNIMLVTVTERTREIGVRKAIGAKDRDILSQFLIEAVLMTTVGGLIGVGLGVGVSNLIPEVPRFKAWLNTQGLKLLAAGIPDLSTFKTLLQPYAIVLALLFSMGVGIFFGFYPASRAAKLDPIEALRYE